MIREIEYFNARLWGMRESLLPESLHETLLAASSSDAWVAALRSTPYSRFLGPSIDTYDSRTLYRAVDACLASRTHKLTRLVSGRPGRALGVCLAEQDLQNLLTVMSGIHNHAYPLDILSGTLPSGLLGSEQLEALTHCGTNREAADLLASWAYPYHYIYRCSIGRQPDKPLPELRLNLNLGFMEALLADARRCGYAVILSFIQERLDRINLIMALLWRNLPSDRSPMEFYLKGGLSVDRRTFRRMLAAANPNQVVSCLPSGPLKQSAVKTIMIQGDLLSVSQFETSLDGEIIHRYSRPLALDPLGAEMLLSYVLRLRREGIRLKQSLTRLLLGIPIDMFQEIFGYV